MANREREIQLKFRVTPEERELIEAKMAQLGTQNMAAYLRKMALDGYVVRLELPELREMVSLLRRSSNNLNQLTRRVHETGRIYDADLEDLRQGKIVLVTDDETRENEGDFICAAEFATTTAYLYSTYERYAEIRNENSARGKGADCDMLTHEKVLKVFGPYLDADPDYEVVKTSRGYTLLAWNNRREEWFSAEFCKTPEDLRDALLDAYVNYLEYVVTDEDRDPTKPEMREIQKKRQAMYAECMKEGL